VEFVQPTIAELLKECERLHGHICPGQLLGVRMALLGCRLVEITDPRGADRKRVIVWVEIDRCMADAVGAVVGVSLGRRSLKFLDYGKVAASFLNQQTGKAVRIAALDSSRELADALHPEIGSKKERQMLAYRELPDDALFKVEAVSIELTENDLPGHPKRRVACSNCSEGINDGREVNAGQGLILCRPCAQVAYYSDPRPITFQSNYLKLSSSSN
jgi:formylmethanofuran dehydrogenase subunit E